MYNVGRAYYDAVLAEEAVRVADTSVAVATTHVTATEDRYDAGLVSEYDVLRAKVQLTNLETARRNARNGRDAAKWRLLTFLDMPPTTELALTDRLKFEPTRFDLDESLGLASAQRPELRQLELSRVIGEESVKMARGGDNPTVVLSANFKEYAQAFSIDFGEDWSDQTTLALAVSWPLFDGFATRARVGKARAALARAGFAKIQAEEGVDLEVRASYESLLTLEATVRMQKDNVDLARRGLDIAQARYDAGLMSNLEVLDAQAALTQAELGYFQSLHDYELATWAFRRARGELDAMTFE
jgi:outer membrane protein TolC